MSVSEKPDTDDSLSSARIYRRGMDRLCKDNGPRLDAKTKKEAKRGDEK
jgi:hypothetical protein